MFIYIPSMICTLSVSMISNRPNIYRMTGDVVLSVILVVLITL